MHTFDVVKEIKGFDDNVIKYVFETKGDKPAIFEAVLYKYPTYTERTVMCISVQSGCPMGCTFCGTGKFYNRNATEDEILAQVSYMATKNEIILKEVLKLQIMAMSMGEPLLNAPNVVAAFDYINAWVPTAKLLISTAAPRSSLGWDKVMDMCKRNPAVGLQFSVHASTDEERTKIMPMKAKLSLLEISEKGRQFYELTGRRPYFNYCVHAENGTDTNADQLTALFPPEIWEATLSVICEPDETMSGAVGRQGIICNEFSSKLVERGFNTRVFNPAGQDDIGGGCGQLWHVQEWARENTELMRQSTGNKCLSIPLEIPSNFTSVAKHKIKMQQKQGYVITSSTESEVILKRQADIYGNNRDNYQRADPYGRFYNCSQSADLFNDIEASIDRLRSDSADSSGDVSAALSEHADRIDKLMADFRKSVPNFGD